MRKEFQFIGLGLIISLYSIKGDGGLIIPWEIQLIFGLLIMSYGTYLLLQNEERKKALKYILPAWGIFIIVGLISISGGSDKTTILKSDIEPSINFEGIQTCDEGKEKARTDLENGELRYMFGGFGSRQPLAENLKKYGVEVIKLNGLVGVPNECYNQIMYEEIQKRFGEDIFNRENK